MPCKVCKHNQVKDIDRALLTGVSLPSLSQTYGFSTEALRFHHEHLQKKMAQAQQRFHDGLHQGLLCKLSIVMELVLGVVRGARAGEDFKLFLQATREFTRVVSLMVKMPARLEPEMIYCLMASPQWDLQEGTLLPNSIQALSATRQSLKVNLFAPCPDLDAAPELEPAIPPPLATPTSTLKTPVTQVPAAPRPRHGNRQRKKANEKLAGQQREINAKLARKKNPSLENIVNYQEDTPSKKNSSPQRENLLQRLYRKWKISGKLPGKTSPENIIVS